MEDEIIPASPPEDPAPATNPPAGTKANAAFAKARLEAKQAQKRAMELEAKLKAHEQSQLSDGEKLQARVKELESYEPEVQMFRQRAERQRDDMLKMLPKEKRDRLQVTIEGLSLAQQLGILEATIPDAVARPADVPRGSPTQPKRLPTIEQINNDPSLLNGLSKEEIGALAGQAGIQSTTGKVWG